MPKIKRLEIRGFRAFGSQPQAMDFHGPMAVVWGPNSQGKTSIAEAIEFLLTGKTVRREFLASAKREFAEALRNAHMPRTEDVTVSADIEDATGKVHLVRRRLVRDYTGRSTCESELTIDGTPASNLTSLGIWLSQPPLEAPVLMPHTLRYVVSAEPQRRTEYFKAILEVRDLEEVRTAISDAKNQLAPPPSPVEDIFQRCRDSPPFAAALAPLEAGVPSLATVTETLSRALGGLLHAAGPAPDSFEKRLSAARQLLNQRRAMTFPIDSLELGGEPSWSLPEANLWRDLDNFIRIKSDIDRETSRLVRLFEDVLNIPEIADAAVPVDCPVCETPEALTPERIATIRNQLEASTEFRRSKERAKKVLQELADLASRMPNEIQKACPPFLTWSNEERSMHGFNETAINGLLGERSAQVVPPWKQAASSLETLLSNLTRTALKLERLLRKIDLDELATSNVADLRNVLLDLSRYGNGFSDAWSQYGEASGALICAVREEVDRLAGTEGWQDLIDLAEHRQELVHWLAAKAAYEDVLKEVDEAIRQIDDAKGQILDDKFTELSQEILRWWNLLRPHEPTCFDGVQRGGTGRRYLDLKARLEVGGREASGGILRDAVAVFSDSQLNCLGLSAFLARTVREGSEIVVLDDPVPASDEEHRAFFIDRVLNELISASIQIILLTHDERMWRDVQERYKHLELDTFLVNMEDPSAGATIEKRSDTLDALIARASPYIGNPNPEIRKVGAQRLRDAAERFCKLLLVRHRHDRGDSGANVSDYSGKNLGELVPQVEPLLTKDPSHPGKVRVIGQRLNPGAHDDQVPPLGDLRQCLGDLRALRKAYLP